MVRYHTARVRRRADWIGIEIISEIFSLKLAAAIRVVALVNVFFNVGLRVIDTYTLGLVCTGKV